MLILTEWKEFADPSLYGDKLVVDGRGVVQDQELRRDLLVST